MVIVNLDERLKEITSSSSKVIERFITDIKVSIDPLVRLLPLAPLTPGPDATSRLECRKANLSKAIRLDGKDIDVEYTIIEQSKWFGESRHRATVILRQGEMFEGFCYFLPTKKTPIDPEQVELGVEVVEQFCIIAKLSPDSEISLMRLVTSVAGCADFELEFLKRKNRFAQTLYSANLTEVQKTVLNACDKLQVLLTAEKLQEKLNQSITTEVDRAKAKLETLVKSVETSFAELHQKRTQELEAKMAECDKKVRLLDEKLNPHRIKLDASFDHAVAQFEEFFPDHEQNYHYQNTYNTKVDSYLRTFYLLLLKKDLGENPAQVSIEDAVHIIGLIRTTCYLANNRPSAAELREIYAGFRAVLDFLQKHEISTEEAIKKLENISQLRKNKKPEVEVFLELTFAYDFDMNLYRAGLHNLNARSKSDLGLK